MIKFYSKKISYAVLLFTILLVVGGTQSFSEQKTMTVAILDFKVLSGVSKDEVNLLKDFLSNALFETGVFEIVQKERLETVLKEIEFSYSDMADPDKAKKIGKLLSANLLLFGSIGKIGKYVIINLTLVDVETGKTAGTYSNNYLSMEDIVSDMSGISNYLAVKSFPEYIAKTKDDSHTGDSGKTTDKRDLKTETSTFYNNPELFLVQDFEKKDWIIDDTMYYTSDGRYVLYAPKDENYTWITTFYDDFGYEIDAEYFSGNTGTGFGLIYRLTDVDNFYIFCISQNGMYAVFKKVNGEYLTIIAWTKSALIHPSSSNNLKVLAIGDYFSFQINKEFLAEATDSTFTTGYYGFYAGTSLKVAFDKIRIYRGDLIVYDTFTDDRGAWNFSDTVKRHNEQLQLSPKREGCMTYAGSYILKNFSFQADTEFLFGDNSGYGLVFKAQDSYNLCGFIINESGQYYLGTVINNTWTTHIDWKESKFINKKGKNKLKVECRNGYIRLYINDNFVDEVQDNSFEKGKLGFIAFGNEHINADNVAIFSIK